MKPIAHIIETVKLFLLINIVNNQLKTLIPVGTAIIIVAAVK
jgi:hypothetical protein